MALRIMHAVALAHHVVSIYWLLKPKDYTGVSDTTALNLQRYPCRFFTGWNLVTQTVFLCACVFGDLCSNKSRFARQVARFADFTFWSLVFPGTIFVATVFWALFSLDRELVYPAAIDAVLPWLVNHAMHTDILVVLAVGLCRPRRMPPRALGLSVLAAYSVSYNCVFLHAYFDGKVWIYPIFTKLGAWPNQLWLIAFSSVAMILLYFLGEHVNENIWGKYFQKDDKKRREKSENKKVK